MEQQMRKKRERGANYTPQEKTFLVDLVKQYKQVIEDKRTSGVFVTKKKEAWKAITIRFNRNSTSGTRGTEQLKALYDNLKQKARKNVAERYKANYAITVEDLSRSLEHTDEDQNQFHETEGGPYEPSTDEDEKIVTIIKEEPESLPNSYDSGAEYFGDWENRTLENEVAVGDEEGVENSIDIEETNIKQEQQDMTQDNIIQDDTESTELTNESIATVKTGVRRLIKKRNNLSAESLKHIYFKRKCQVANLEKKKLMQEIRQQTQQHNLKMRILQLKLNKYRNLHHNNNNDI